MLHLPLIESEEIRKRILPLRMKYDRVDWELITTLVQMANNGDHPQYRTEDFAVADRLLNRYWSGCPIEMDLTKDIIIRMIKYQVRHMPELKPLLVEIGRDK